MDFSVIFQLRTKKFWWLDVIFYFVVSSLVATVFLYFIFLFKNGMVKMQIEEEMTKLQEVGTLMQKEHEKEVMVYQKKIGDFSLLLKNHEFASNAFAFMQAQTMPNIWFSQFNLDQRNSALQLTGEADDMDAFSRQVAILEENKYVSSVGTFSSSLGEAARTEFNVSLVLDKSIFDYLPNISPAPLTPDNQDQANPDGSPAVDENLPAGDQQVLDSQKLITSFHLISDPEVVGELDYENYVITLTVPYGTDIKNLAPRIVVTPETTIQPESFVVQDFTNPVIYKVTAKDGSVQNYQVKVVVAPEIVKEIDKSNQSGLMIIIVIIVAVVVVALSVWIFLKRKRKKDINNISKI
ncbi:MAG: hypothetical protein WC711_02550 [Candidatus Staskawiczbacteria bacterium]|jgi:hypothetical protein